MEIQALTIHALQELLAKGEITAVEVTEAFLARIDRVEERVGAFITLDRESALAQAAAADRQRAAGQGGELCGIPLALKDIVCTKGLTDHLRLADAGKLSSRPTMPPRSPP